MRSRVYPLLLALAALALGSPLAHGQGHTQPVRPRTASSLTFGVGGSNFGLVLSGLVGHRRGLHEIGVRGLLGLNSDLHTGGSRTLLDAGFLYGLHPLRNRALVALRAGVSGIWYTEDDGHLSPRVVHAPVVGLPFELALRVPVAPRLALGVTGAANFNRVRRYAGLLLTVTLGPS